MVFMFQKSFFNPVSRDQEYLIAPDRIRCTNHRVAHLIRSIGERNMDILWLGEGGTYGAIACERSRTKGTY